MVDYILIDDDIKDLDKTVACIGYFDGVHLGHQSLIEKTIIDARNKDLDAAAIVFDASNNSYLKNTGDIVSFDIRIKLIKHFGIDQIYVINLDEETMKLSKDEFLDKYLNKLNLDTLYCGEDFHFGYKAEGDFKTLLKGNFKAKQVNDKLYENYKISSRTIRNALKEGNLKLVNKLLGYHYFLKVKVINEYKDNDLYTYECEYFDKNLIRLKEGIYEEYEIKNDRIYFNSSLKHYIGNIYLL